MIDLDKEYELDCDQCNDGVLQWTLRDSIAVCDSCSREIEIDELMGYLADIRCGD